MASSKILRSKKDVLIKFKHLFFLTIFIGFSSLSFAQVSNKSWSEIYSDENVAVDYLYASCDDDVNGTHKELVFLKFKNLTSSKIKVYFEKELWYNDKCINCNSSSSEKNFSVMLNQNETIEGNCEGAGNKNLIIFSKMTKMKAGSKLTKFELKNVRITFY